MLAELIEAVLTPVVAGALAADLSWAREAARQACEASGGGYGRLEVEAAVVGNEVLVTVYGAAFGRPRRNFGHARFPAWQGQGDVLEYVRAGAAHVQGKLARDLAARL